MSEVSVAPKPTISDGALLSFVRCIEAMDANLRRRLWPERYAGLAQAIENLLLSEGNNEPWAVIALADLAAAGWQYLSPEKGSHYLMAAAIENYVPAQYELACRARRGQIRPTDLNPLRNLHELSRWELEDFNREEAVHWMTVAAENGSLDARYRLGMEKIISGDPKVFADGVSWLKLVVRQIPQEGDEYDDEYYDKAKYVLAYQMELGRVEPAPAEQMFRLCEAAANADVPEAMLAAGHYLEYGIGVERDTDAAAAWYRKAAECGHDEGHLLAGLLSGYDDDLKKAAKAGHVAAMLIMAPRELDQGYGSYGFDSFMTGVGYYEAAASRGSLEAALALAEIYEDCGWRGITPEDWEGASAFSPEHSQYERLEHALYCYEQAKELGWEYADQNIERVQKLMDGTGVDD